MKRAILGAVLCAACAAVSEPAAVCAVAPPWRLAREARIVWLASGEQATLRAAGTHELRFQCGHVPGRTESLTVQITRTDPTADPYCPCTPQEVIELARRGAFRRVRFRDALMVAPVAGSFPGGMIPLPDGRAVAVGYGFGLRSGLMCLVPEERAELRELARAASQEDELALRGIVVGMIAEMPCVLVEEARIGAQAEARDEPPWAVALLSGGSEIARVTAPGLYVANIPCAHRPGAAERARMALRDLKLVDLSVQGHPLTAELADTEAARQWGLQSYSALGEGEGMLFFNPQAGLPTIVMKTVSFPISVAFIRPDGVIAAIGDLRPGELRELVSPVPVHYVLEVQQGWFARHGIGPGATVQFR